MIVRLTEDRKYIIEADNKEIKILLKSGYKYFKKPMVMNSLEISLFRDRLFRFTCEYDNRLAEEMLSTLKILV